MVAVVAVALPRPLRPRPKIRSVSVADGRAAGGESVTARVQRKRRKEGRKEAWKGEREKMRFVDEAAVPRIPSTYYDSRSWSV